MAQVLKGPLPCRLLQVSRILLNLLTVVTALPLGIRLGTTPERLLPGILQLARVTLVRGGVRRKRTMVK